MIGLRNDHPLSRLTKAAFSADPGMTGVFFSIDFVIAMAWCRDGGGKGQEVVPMDPVGRLCWPVPENLPLCVGEFRGAEIARGCGDGRGRPGPKS